jgi:hypothetical protein
MERLHNSQDLFDYLESRDRGRLTEGTAKKFFQQLVQINLAMLKYVGNQFECQLTNRLEHVVHIH